MLGLMLENGPLHVAANGSLIPNQFSWDKLVDYIWVDQPVCVISYFQSAAGCSHLGTEEQAILLLNQMVVIVRIHDLFAAFLNLTLVLVENEDQMGEDFVSLL